MVGFFEGMTPNYRYTTDPKIDMEPQNGGLEDEFPFQLDDFRFCEIFRGVFEPCSKCRLVVFMFGILWG